MEKKISLIIPVCNEQDNLEELCSKIISSIKNMNYEIIFIDDGSCDNSLNILKRLAELDKRIKVINFRRNFGQTAAIVAGFDVAEGEILITLDADLQNDPAEIPKLIGLIDGGFDIVCGWRKNRKDNVITRKIPSFFANKLISLVTGIKLHDYGCTLKAYRKEIVKDIKLYGEMHRFLPALAAWAGARIAETEVSHNFRKSGKSKYGLSRIYKVLLDLVTVKFLMSYSTKPIYVFGGLGIFSFLLGFLSMLVVSYRVFILKHLEATPLVFMMVVFFTAGIQLILMGLLAEVLIRTHFEAQNRPIYFVKERINI